jgi:hypothetical protein
MVLAIAITVAWIIQKGQAKQRAEAEKRQIQRPLGQVKPSEAVDQSKASKEVILSNKRLNPPTGSEAAARAPTQVSFPAAAPIERVALPTLVSFYA